MHINHLVKDIKNSLHSELQCQTTCTQYAWWLIQAATKRTHIELITNPHSISQKEITQVQGWVNEIINHKKPIGYIIGSVPFGALSIDTKPPVLLPRPETESWTLQLIETLKNNTLTDLNILDMCTGSGCIALALGHALPTASVTAVDISRDALDLAVHNKKKLGINNVTYIESDLFKNLQPHNQFDLIVSNPPYISAREYEQLDRSVSDWEDAQALCADDNGLALLHKIIKQAPQFMKKNTKLQAITQQLHVEIGWQQADAVTKLMKKHGYLAITVTQDEAQKDRTVSGNPHVATTTTQTTAFSSNSV